MNKTINNHHGRSPVALHCVISEKKKTMHLLCTPCGADYHRAEGHEIIYGKIYGNIYDNLWIIYG